LRIPGINYDGGYAEAMVAPAEALALVPHELSARRQRHCCALASLPTTHFAKAGRGQAISWRVEGLGHLGVQFAAKMGFRTVAIARGRDKEKLARQLRAHVYLDSQ
jgi:alcohol dehydrogenase/propanol-preferring alcohol dehydrogenase